MSFQCSNGQQGELCSMLLVTVDFLLHSSPIWSSLWRWLFGCFSVLFCNFLVAGMRTVFDTEEWCSFHCWIALHGLEGPGLCCRTVPAPLKYWEEFFQIIRKTERQCLLFSKEKLKWLLKKQTPLHVVHFSSVCFQIWADESWPPLPFISVL